MRTRLILWLAALGTVWGASAAAMADDEKAPAPISYDKQVRPILQAHCQGCHQPAKAGGSYVMTSFEGLLKGGESGEPAIAPGKPDESQLIDMITPHDGAAEMPRDRAPLHETEIATIAQWIAEGAVDDSPHSAGPRYDAEHPPEYRRPPAIPALAFSPDGSILAVAGFHEVTLWKGDGSERIARLVGLSRRVNSLAFSPDGSKLAAAGGVPATMGEIQVWDVAKRELLLSVPTTFDTVHGASWSPDGSKIAYGCADHSVRAIDAKSGEQILFMGSHDDWALATTFSKDGSHLISAGRDMSAKLTEVATQRFVDNITSITPGALKGGLMALARRPDRDEIVIGGSDGQPRVYRIFRQTTRVIGDDSNLMRELPPLSGRVFGVAVSPDGKRIAAAGSLDGASGEAVVYSYEFDDAYPDAIKAIQGKVVTTRSADENAAVAAYHKEGVKEISRFKTTGGGLYAVAFRPDGAVLATAGGDGLVRLVNPETGALVKEFVPVPIAESAPAGLAANEPGEPLGMPEEPASAETAPAAAEVASLHVEPAEIVLDSPAAYVQIVATAKLASGDVVDVTRLVEVKVAGDAVEVSPRGLVKPRRDGRATLTLALAGKTVEMAATARGISAPMRPDFVRDVTPILSRVGCNQGTCHGSAQGKNGFKLSLRGYDPLFDVTALRDDDAARRVNPASPDASLMLEKPIGAVPHGGGQLMEPGDAYYQILHAWIDGGAALDREAAKVDRIDVFPENPIVPRPGQKQQVRVVATYPDGSTRDVTREAFLESGNTEVATADRFGLVTALRRGEAPVLVRYEGRYASTTLTVMGERQGFVWEQPPSYGPIDDLVASKWERMKIRPSEPCGDAEFLRRVSIDLTGLPPTVDEVRAFLDDPTESRAKREALVDRLIGSPAFVEHWTNKWADLLQVNPKFLGAEGAAAFREWIRGQVAADAPYDAFARAILTASGSNHDNPPASYYKILRNPESTMENTTQLFLGIRFNCNKCHDHPFERWTQDQYYQTAAFFAHVDLKGDPASAGKTIGGTDVEAPKPLYETVADSGTTEVVHDRTKEATAPKFPFDCDYPDPGKDATRREQLAAWLTSPNNPYFARGYVNRLWGYLFGVGIIEPLDDVRAGNPATNPELLDYLTKEFISNNFSARHVLALICKSRTYQLSVSTNDFNADDKVNYSHALARRLPAEALLDAVNQVTGSVSHFPGVAPGTRAAALADAGTDPVGGFLSTFGRPVRESACECERSDGLQLGPIMALVSGPILADAIADPANELTRLVGSERDDSKLVEELFLRILNRPATSEEVATCLAEFGAVEEDHRRLAETLGRKETEFALERPGLERDRLAAIAAAEAELAAFEAESAPKIAAMEKERADRVAKLEADLKAYEEEGLPAKIREWEKANAGSIVDQWTPLDPATLSASNGAKLAKLADGSILVSGENRNGEVVIAAETDLADITGIRLEVLTDPSLPAQGPGRAGDGNFVLSEIEVSAAPKGAPDQSKPVALKNALADFSQAEFDVAKAIDGKLDDQRGWAVSPRIGILHWATFETAEPVGGPGGAALSIKLHHRFNDLWTLGRFRLSVTRRPNPGLSLAEDLRAALATAPETRSEAQNAVLLSYHRGMDAELAAKRAALAAAQAPPPADPKLAELKANLERAKQPVAVDPSLVRLRQDLDMSVRQAASRRLTAAQDIAWALINSPAFLFNH